MKRAVTAALCAACWAVVCAPGCAADGEDGEPEVVVLPSDDGKADAVASDGRRYHLRRDGTRVPRRLRIDEGEAMGSRQGIDRVAIARAFLRANAALFRLAPEIADLRVEARAGAVDFVQLVGGRPLFGAGVRVDIDAGGAVALVHSRYVAGLTAPAAPVLSDAPAALAAAARAGVHGEVAELGWAIALGRPVAVYWVRGAEGSALVDAADGRLRWLDPARRDVSGRGSAYRENAWADDGASEVTLPALDPSGALSGSKVRVDGGGHAVNGRAAGYVFDYPLGSPGFGQVTAYHQVDDVARWLARIGVGGRKRPITIRWGAAVGLNAYFDPRADHIVLGWTLGFDVATDGDVVVHEYGHAVVHAHAPELLGASPDVLDAAIHEGYADFLACSKHDNPLMAESLHLAVQRQGGSAGYLREIGFDARTPGRPCDARRRWPADGSWDPHVSGMILCGALWDLRAALLAQRGAAGASLALRLAFAGLDHLGAAGNDFSDVLEGILEADRRQGGAHARAIRAAFAAHGIHPDEPVNLHVGPPYVR